MSKRPAPLAPVALTPEPQREGFRSLKREKTPLPRPEARHPLGKELGPRDLGGAGKGADHAHQTPFALPSPDPRAVQTLFPSCDRAPVPGLQPTLCWALMKCAESIKVVYSGLIERERVNCLH